jgi:HEAT repeat protein
MGTNCIPVLLRMICAKDSTLKVRMIALAQKQHLIKIRFVPAADKNVEASRAFIVLGDAAKDAVAELVKAYAEDVSLQSRGAIADALAWIGPSAKPAIPLLLRAATNSDSQLRANALWALGEIHAEPSLCVPRLINALGDSNSWAQLCAAHALGRFGADASAAIPSLTRLAEAEFKPSPLMVNEVQVTLEARNALHNIAPAAEALPEFEFPTVDLWILPRD